MKKLMKLMNFAVIVMALCAIAGCDKETNEWMKYEGVDFKIEGLDYNKSNNGMLYEAQIPAEGAEFTVQEVKQKNVHAILNCIRINDKLCIYLPLDKTLEPHYEGAEWGSVDIDQNLNPTKYTFKISPNNTGETRKVNIEFNGPYIHSSIILTQPSLRQ